MRTTIDKAGRGYVTTDTKRGVEVFSADGKFLRSVGPTLIHALEIRPIWAEKGEFRECAYGSENAYGLFQRDSNGQFLREHLSDYQATRKLAYAEGIKYGVEVIDLLEAADLQRVRERFKIGESKSTSFLSEVI